MLKNDVLMRGVDLSKMNGQSERLPTSRQLERLQPQHPPRLQRRSHLPSRVARVLRQLLNQRPVRIRLRPIRQIERVLQPRAQVPCMPSVLANEKAQRLVGQRVERLALLGREPLHGPVERAKDEQPRHAGLGL